MLTAVQLAKGYIALNEGINNVMLVAGDKWSQFTRFHSADSVFFGDGGGAVILGKDHEKLSLLGTKVITRGDFHDLWWVQAGALKQPASEETLKKGMHIYLCSDIEWARSEFKEIFLPLSEPVHGRKGSKNQKRGFYSHAHIGDRIFLGKYCFPVLILDHQIF